MQNIYLPNSVMAIGSNPFVGCSMLQDIDASPGNKKYQQIDGVLFDKSMNKLVCYPAGKNELSYTIPNEICVVGESAFYQCDTLTNIDFPLTVTHIEDGAFSYCSGLNYIELPDALASLGAESFYMCINLSGIILPEGLAVIGDGAFSSTSLINVEIPSSTTSIGEGVFWGCDNLVYISLPDELTHLGNNIFNACSSLSTIKLPDYLISIGDSSFSYCEKLKNIEMPNSLICIGNRAFSDCIHLAIDELPSGVTSIGDWAFYGCESLDGITLPKGLISIEQQAFGGCKQLASISIPGSVSWIQDNALLFCSDEIVLHVEKNSYAMQWAKENGYDYMLMNSEQGIDIEPDATITEPSERATYSSIKDVPRDGYILPDRDKRCLTDDEVRALPKSMLGYARNEIFARYGRPFVKQMYKEYFDSRDWYRTNSSYDVNNEEHIVTSLEWVNAVLIMKYENPNAN